MKIGPKYKIARRLGAPIFEKTQTQKFALSESKRARQSRRPRSRTQYAIQVAEKQKARLMYGITENQFSNYVGEAMEQSEVKPTEALYQNLEKRLDNVAYVLGFASTRRFARQMVSHGHITVNGRKITIPSYRVSEGDKIAFREGSKKGKLFTDAQERTGERDIPAWLSFNAKNMEAEVKGAPNMSEARDLLFDLEQIIEFYSR